MGIVRKDYWCALLTLLALPVIGMTPPANELRLPEFGRDTVLVWKVQNLDYEASFVARIALFLPDRFLEWEDEQNQGTVFMPNRDLLSAGGFVNSAFFIPGADIRSRGATTLWLSQKIYRGLKEKKKVKCTLDGVGGFLEYSGDGQFPVEVNRSEVILPVIKVSDDRGTERWFLDQEQNPLMVLHRVRKFSQTLTSVTTDKTNTLRWIKGKKLANPPR
jgi:hypothetical protein